MTKQWYQIKEKSAGRKRLVLTWYIYKFFGKFPVNLIACIVSFITYVFAREQRMSVKKYLNILSCCLKNKKYSYSFFRGLRIFLNFADSLVDRMLVFSGNFNKNKIKFEDKETKNKILNLLKNKKGIFFITSHVGNAEIIRALLASSGFEKPNVNIFLEKNQCKIFNDFIKEISIKIKGIQTFAIEDIDMATSTLMFEKLSLGEILFMAGDRISKKTSKKVNVVKIFNEKVELPSGVFRFAYLMRAPLFFICAIKEKGEYKIYAEEFLFNNKENKKETLKKISEKYAGFIENLIIKYPYQNYNFFDMFEAQD